MALTDYDFTRTRNQIIERAFRIIGALHPGDPMSAEMLSQAVEAMNTMVQSWQSRHVFLWKLREYTQTLTAGQASYSLALQDPPIYAVDSAWFRNNGDDDRIAVGSWRQYTNIIDKDETGDPELVAITPTDPKTLYVWPVPTKTETLYYLGIVKLQDFDTASGTPEFPVRYLKALTYGLAAELAPEYGIPGAEQDRLERKAAREFMEAKGGERERADFEFIGGAFED